MSKIVTMSAADNAPAPSSTQQPSATPQPGFVSSVTANQATSPPTKQNLKSWWATFRKERPKQESNVQQYPNGIFGVPLRQSITYANVAISLVDSNGKSYIYGYVPIVVAKCGVYLKEKATNVEGIFRLSGSEKRIKELRALFDSPDRYGKGLDWAGYTVHDAANVLRRYLNQLPEPIVPLDLYERFREPLRGHVMQAVGDADGMQLPDTFDMDKAIVIYQRLITELPPLNRQLLLYILDLLAVFASKADENRMTSQNLAAIFQPGMLSHPQHDMAPSEYRLSQDVLIFLIENQDNFLIGMRGTAADEQTVQAVQGGTPPPGTPSTPIKANMVTRSASSASAGAESVRKFGGIRRNVSVSSRQSRQSRQSNGAPSPASPAFGPGSAQSNSGGVHRSNTVPSKKSPGLPSSRRQKGSGSPSPTSAAFLQNQGTAPRNLIVSHAHPAPPSPGPLTHAHPAPPSPGLVPASPTGKSSLAPSSHVPVSAVASQERLLGVGEQNEKGLETPSKERTVSGFFNRSPTAETEKKTPNKLRKKRIPSSQNPSAHSSSQSLNAQQYQSASVSPAFPPTGGSQVLEEHPIMESEPSANAAVEPSVNISAEQAVDTSVEQAINTSANPELSTTAATPVSEEPEPQLGDLGDLKKESDTTLRPKTTPPASAHSRSSSDGSRKEKDRRNPFKRLSRHRNTSQEAGHSGHGSSSSVGSGGEDKPSLLGRIKDKMRSKKEDTSIA